ncbi:MAG: hypothetical protein LUI87_15585 [Lachnospiraceae bacterium]|nr:hypothetical protein [Lachnospiraceae bacterium]
MTIPVDQELKKPEKKIPDELYYKIEERVNARRLMLKKISYLEKNSDTEKNTAS